MESLSSISDLSYRAVELLRNGSYDESIQTWAAILRCVLTHIEEREEARMWPESVPCHGSSIVAVHLHQPCTKHDETTFSLFNRALVFVANSDDASSPLNYDRLAAMCLFNIGLCRHIAGLQTETSKVENLKQAIVHYKKAVAV